MAMKASQHIIKGMQRDISVSKFNPEYVFDAQNIRITARDNNTLLSVTNERGNKIIDIKNESGDTIKIPGVLIGYNVLNNFVTLFTTGEFDCIYRLEYKDTYFESKLLYSGKLNFNSDYPIESIGIYENDDLQKVYWIDGINQPRVINIRKDYTNSNGSLFDFAPSIKLEEAIAIHSDDSATGQFPSGVVQYAFTYYNLYGQETNIVNQSSLYYTYKTNRGGSPEETASNGFKLTFINLDESFDYIRIYSIVRTSINAEPTVKVVADLKVTRTIYYTDNNTSGYTIDPTVLLYIGGESIIPSTMTQKDNTLFFGNLKIARSLFSKESVEAVKGNIEFYKSPRVYSVNSEYYNYTNQLEDPSSTITTFKSNETYRFGVQFQHETGRLSEVLFINDSKVDIKPAIEDSGIPGYYYIQRIKGRYDIPKSVINEARKLGYVRARGVIVYPTGSDKEVLCQGVVNSTVYDIRDRNSGTPYAQSSWFFRPFVDENNIGDIDNEFDALHGTYAEYKDGATVNTTQYSRSTEIGVDLYSGGESNPASNYVAIDSNIVTLNSPDIELGSSVDYLSDSSLNFRIVGSVQLSALLSDREVTSSTPNLELDDYGFFDRAPSNKHTPFRLTEAGGRMLISSSVWLASGKKNQTTNLNNPYGWLVSPWQRNDSLVNDVMPANGAPKAAMLQYNRLSNLRISDVTRYFYSNDDIWNPPAGISTVGIFNSNEVSLTKISSNGNSYTYYGNIDKVITPLDSEGKKRTTNIGVAFPEIIGGAPDRVINRLFTGAISPLWTDSIETIDDKFKTSNGVVSMKYKSTKHAVFAFNKVDNKRPILPTNGTIPEGTSVSYDPNAIISTITASYDGLWLGELYRTVSPDSRFGGNTEEALSANIWTIAGDFTNINVSSTIINFTEGDTYFQRYDCLKTYPFTLEDQNSVTEILSFFCETSVNIDGRYDRNRGQSNNLSMSPTNFNLINPVYSQRNNFFTYTYNDRNKVSPDIFTNSITWSKEKTLGEVTDTWTNVTMASTLDLDGDKGEIVSLNTFNNEIFCFQRRGLSNILFNSRVQIPTSDGTPIEITNGLKVSGKRYISNSIGCVNKWSIAESPSGLYFVDNETNSLYLFNGQVDSLSDRLGFRQWINEYNTQDKWDPVNYNNYRSFYDKNNNDVYFTYKDHCLCYSELLGQFTSFMSYEKVPAMFNVNSEFFAFKDEFMWEQFKGDYNMFFGYFKPYSFTIVANADEPYDKIFNTVEFRADSWDNDVLLNNKTFDTLEVWNEYQHGKLYLRDIIGHVSPLKRKFRVWRANIPRDDKSKMNRIRNTWAYIKLEMNEPNTYRTDFHDMIVQYFI